MKRFWRSAGVAAAAEGFAVTLDAKPVKTPAHNPLLVPTQPLAQAIAAEWDQQVDEIKPETMPLMKLAATAIDRIEPQRDSVIAETAKYAETDLICYIADEPVVLGERQKAVWDPLHGFVHRRYDVTFAKSASLMHTQQPEVTVSTLKQALTALDAFRLTAVADVTGIAGSLVIALALLDGEITAEEAHQAALVDELYQADEWGSDYLAEERRALILKDLAATEHFLKCLA